MNTELGMVGRSRTGRASGPGHLFGFGQGRTYREAEGGGVQERSDLKCRNHLRRRRRAQGFVPGAMT
eukprot:scaffold29666_cov106-Isochrysis_galbana.AAC.1